MKIVIAPDSFKESLSGKIAFDAIERGKKSYYKPSIYNSSKSIFYPLQ